MESKRPIRVMFVCTGNICRSPMAEAVFAHLVDEAGLADRFEIASSGTGAWHVGERPHRGTQAVLRTHQVPLRSDKRAQRLTSSDMESYDYILVMDGENLADIASTFPAPLRANVRRLLEFAPPGSPQDVVDPYYHDNFEDVYQIVTDGCRGLLISIREREGV